MRRIKPSFTQPFLSLHISFFVLLRFQQKAHRGTPAPGDGQILPGGQYQLILAPVYFPNAAYIDNVASMALDKEGVIQPRIQMIKAFTPNIAASILQRQ